MISIRLFLFLLDHPPIHLTRFFIFLDMYTYYYAYKSYYCNQQIIQHNFDSQLLFVV